MPNDPATHGVTKSPICSMIRVDCSRLNGCGIWSVAVVFQRNWWFSATSQRGVAGSCHLSKDSAAAISRPRFQRSFQARPKPRAKPLRGPRRKARAQTTLQPCAFSYLRAIVYLQAIVVQHAGGRTGDAGDRTQIFVNCSQVVTRHVVEFGPRHDLEQRAVKWRRDATGIGRARTCGM